MKYIAEGKVYADGIKNGVVSGLCRAEFDNLDRAVDWLTEQLFEELGDGDGENGGKGSLRNCETEIRETLTQLNPYTYANTKFQVITA